MKIVSIEPPPPPREITMTFPVTEGWAIVAALHYYAEHHPEAVSRNRWHEWARELDEELRRGR